MGGPHPGLPGMVPTAAGFLGLGAGLPGAPASHAAAVAAAAAAGAHPLLKPADLHVREAAELKGPGSANTEERLVRKMLT